MINRITLLIFLTCTTTCCLSQNQHFSLNSKNFTIEVKDNSNPKDTIWVINPKLERNMYYTSTVNDTISFISEIDTLSIYIQPLNEYKILINTPNEDKTLSIIKQIDLTKITLPISYIYEKDSTFNIDYEKNVTAKIYPDNIIEKGKIILKSLNLKVEENQTRKIIWEDSYSDISELHLGIDLPTCLLNNPNNYSLFINTVYTQHEKMNHIGLGGWKTITLNGSYVISDIPFSFHIDSQPNNAELFYLDLKTWNIYEKKLKKQFDLEKTYLISQLTNGIETIQYLKSNYSNPRGFNTPTDIYIVDTPYIIFILDKNKIIASKIIPNRNVPQMNRKIIRLQ